MGVSWVSGGAVYSVAIVEDDERDIETLEGYIERFNTLLVEYYKDRI